MRRMACALVVTVFSSTTPHERRANFLYITVTAPESVSVRAIWLPFAGARSFDEQQWAIRLRNASTHPDSVRRWQDPASRDTLSAKTPAEFVVDMNGGPVMIEAVDADSIRVEAQLTPARGPLVASWGRAIRIESDGRTPYVERRR